MNKTKVLVLPLLCWSFVWCVFENIDYISFLKSGWGGYWFLWCLWMSFCILYLLDYFSKKMSMNICMDVLLFVCAYLLTVLLDYICGFDVIFIHKLVINLRYLFLGYFVCKYKLFDYLSNDIVLLLGIICYVLQCYYYQDHNRILIFLGAVGAILVLWNYFKEKGNDSSFINVFFRFIGERTLIIYCAHYFLLSDMSSYINFYLNIPDGFFLQLVCSVLYSIIVCFGCLMIEGIIMQNKILSIFLLGKYVKKN